MKSKNPSNRKGGKINSSFSWCFNCYKFSGCIDGCLLPKERGAKGDTSPAAGGRNFLLHEEILPDEIWILQLNYFFV
ncbi:hypothetical protein AV530_005659 [Patagioenas fasciata monilis]|uniref:Uncharacterized protein n=1 Tax=Patagioenas fasciata monilis TaxID=372326 RepID=A0A1V4JM43_PATFA|nr:hypothetical protein AV530_005659 [Patagioenas fasciata monilis]